MVLANVDRSGVQIHLLEAGHYHSLEGDSRGMGLEGNLAVEEVVHDEGNYTGDDRPDQPGLEADREPRRALAEGHAVRFGPVDHRQGPP